MEFMLGVIYITGIWFGLSKQSPVYDWVNENPFLSIGLFMLIPVLIALVM